MELNNKNPTIYHAYFRVRTYGAKDILNRALAPISPLCQLELNETETITS